MRRSESNESQSRSSCAGKHSNRVPKGHCGESTLNAGISHGSSSRRVLTSEQAKNETKDGCSLSASHLAPPPPRVDGMSQRTRRPYLITDQQCHQSAPIHLPLEFVCKVFSTGVARKATRSHSQRLSGLPTHQSYLTNKILRPDILGGGSWSQNSTCFVD